MNSYASLSRDPVRKPLLSEMVRCRPNIPRMRQSRPDSDLGLRARFLETVQVFPLFSEAISDGRGTLVIR